MSKLRLAGIDLAWKPLVNESGIAVGELSGRTLTVTSLVSEKLGPGSIAACLSDDEALSGIAIDAPTIMRNKTGRRPCESAVTSAYGGRKAGVHSSNLGLYPEAQSVYLAELLAEAGFQHLRGPRWQIEVYPHPALIECFGLKERLAYKKGRVADKRHGQQHLAPMIRALEHSDVLSLIVPAEFQFVLDSARIAELRGAGIKHNEDMLDALICLYIAGLYQLGEPHRVFGDTESGFIVVPTVQVADTPAIAPLFIESSEPAAGVQYSRQDAAPTGFY